jgi:hypothetical protein
VGAEHAVAEKVAAPAEKQQEALGSEEATPEEARIFTLQRQAGNRAVTALLRGNVTPAVQRALSIDPAFFKGRSFKERVRTTFAGADTFLKIGIAVADYRQATEDQQRLAYADIVIGLTEHWLEKYGDDAKLVDRKLKLTTLNREARADARVLRRKRAPQGEQAYLDKIEAGGFKGAMKVRTRDQALNPAEDLAAGRTTKGYQGTDDQAAAIVKQYNLTAAEIAAVRIFTMPDYTYINPAIAGSKSWLLDNLAKSSDDYIKQVDPATLMQEGNEHARKVRQALEKLPPWPGAEAYRGERITKATFDVKYKQGADLPFGAFASAAKLRTVAENYASGRGVDLKPTTKENVGVVAIVHHKTARDISRISASMKKEEEVMILPGTRFKVGQVTLLPTPKDTGKPPAARWYTVHLWEQSK